MFYYKLAILSNFKVSTKSVAIHKAVKISLFFPKEAYFDESLYSVKSDWIKEQLLSSLNINPIDGELFICKVTNIVPF